MTAPVLSQQTQGVTTVSADNLNTYVQWCQTVAQLRAFIGLVGMTVYVQGITTPGDGGQGFFIWQAIVSQSDNNYNYIIPTGAQGGGWVRLSTTGLVSTVGGLPSASVVGAGTRAFVTDATVTTFASIVVGGGSNGVPVFSNGTNWLIG